jgi:cell division protein ZipA
MIVEFNLREWLLILGPVFIAVILLHGYWRMRNGRNNLKMALDKNFLSQPGGEDDVDDLTMLKAELPNGGARIIKANDLDVSQDVPVLMEPAEFGGVDKNVDGAIEEKSDEALEEELAKAFEDELEDAPKYVHASDKLVSPGGAEALVERQLDTDRASVYSKAVYEGPPKASQARKVDRPEKFVVINIFADDEFFNGQELLETLVNLDMSYGEMNIFHRLNEDGFSEFSLANAVEPGTFDLADMHSMQTPGVTMFMGVHELMDPEQVYNELINVAIVLSEELGGTIKDQTRSVMTTQTIEYCRQEIRDFQFRHSV